MNKKHALWSILLCLVFSLNVWADENLNSYFSTLESPIPVQLRNARNENYVIKVNKADDYVGKTVNSGTCGYDANELWYLVGTPDSFKMYSRVVGASLALTLNGNGEGAMATLTAEGTPLCLIQQEDGNYTISPKDGVAQSFNMYGGNGQDIRLYSVADIGSRWKLRHIDVSRALTLRYNAQLDGGMSRIPR